MSQQMRSEISEDSELIKQKISDLVRHAAEERIRLHTQLDEFRIVDDDRGFVPGQVLGNQMALILVSGDAIRITLKLHFSLSEIKPLIYAIYGLDSPNDVRDEQAIDFGKELCNLIAGYVVQMLEENGLPVGISLPLCTRGFYEIFADYRPLQKPIIKYCDLWRLQYGETSIYGTAMVEVLNPALLEPLLSYETGSDDSDDSGEFDFL
ncbi:hypothetical protein OLMES_3862 [Oleiphilus messinensis]|uniref:Chemotaxis phosphatase CheX-like domain-containing protein n=1 Tax=Oleiphilus messinensis TaxID=141451 RepID=A0A1Y0IBH3_9GAMM|nr:hypothetical protein [Oleiphilus messinensis]ARU57882.1 hypothetical protein OLMES_3862 [Oleiphilus messinensis]